MTNVLGSNSALDFLRTLIDLPDGPVEIVSFGIFASGDDPDGDGSALRDTDFSRRLYRAHIAGEIALDPSAQPTFNVLERDLQPSFKWRKEDTERVPGKPAWFRRPRSSSSRFFKSDRADVNQNILSVVVEPQTTEDPSATVTVKLDASIPLFPDLVLRAGDREITLDFGTLAALLPFLADLLPDTTPSLILDFLRNPKPPAISAEFLLDFDQHLPNAPRFQLLGRAHDGFPAFELYLNRSLIYHFYPTDPPTDDLAPLALFSLPGSAGDVTVQPTDIQTVPQAS